LGPRKNPRLITAGARVITDHAPHTVIDVLIAIDTHDGDVVYTVSDKLIVEFIEDTEPVTTKASARLTKIIK